MKEQLIRRSVRFVVRYYYVVLIAAVAISVLAFPRASRLLTNIDTDLTKLLPEKYESVKSMNEVRKKFKSSTSLILVIEDPSPEKARLFVDDISVFLEKDPSVSEVESKKRGYAFFDTHKLLFIDLEDLMTIRDRIDRRIQREKLGGLYIDFEEEGSDKEFKFNDIDEKYKERYSTAVRSEYYTNQAKTIYSVYVYPKGTDVGIADLRNFYDQMQAKVLAFAKERNDPSTKIYFTGSVRTRVDEYKTLIKDLMLAGIIAGIGIFLVLLVYFRRVFAAALIFTPLTMGIVASFAFSSLFIHHLNLVTSFLFAILGGLGVEVGIHMLARYIEERRHGLLISPERNPKTIEDALTSVMVHTGSSALTSAATVAATFFVLIINDFKGFSEFGFIAGFGLVINYVFFVFVFPAVLVFAEKIRFLNFKRGVGFDRPAFLKKRTVTSAAPAYFPLPKFVLAGFAMLLLLTFIDLPHVKFEWRFSMIKAVIPEALEAKAKQRETSKTVNSPAVVIIHNKEEAVAVKRAVEFEIDKRGGSNVIDAIRSYYDLVPDDQIEKLAVVGEMRDLLADKTLKLVKGEHKKDLDRFKEELAKAKSVSAEEVPEKVKELFKGTTGEKNIELAYINPLPGLEMDDGRNAIAFAEQVQRIQTPIGAFHPTSDAIVFADVLRTMISDGKRVVLLAFILVFAIVFADFRKLKDTMLIVSPIVLGIFYMFLIMYMLDIRLNFYNMIVIPTSVGTSIDNSVHLYHRYKEFGRGSLMAALKSSGGAALTSSLTNIFGFLGLVFTSHNGLRSIGDLAVAGLVACLLTTLVYFPALLQLLETRSVTRELKTGAQELPCSSYNK